jgi:hypothetical protein
MSHSSWWQPHPEAAGRLDTEMEVIDVDEDDVDEDDVGDDDSTEDWWTWHTKKSLEKVKKVSDKKSMETVTWKTMKKDKGKK